MNQPLLMDYVNYLISERTAVKVNQLMLISAGKRTPSNLFMAEKNHLQNLFNVGCPLSTVEWEDVLHRLIQQNYVTKKEGIYTGTSLGEIRKKEFTEETIIFKDISSLEFAQTRRVFWNWFVFVSQVLSEIAYENKQYIPYTSNKEEQLIVKRWLKNQQTSIKELRQLWADTFTAYLQDLPDKYRSLLIDQLVGYNKEGLTNRQLSEKYNLSTVELSLVMNHLMQLMIDRLYQTESPIGSLMREVHQLNNFGLSQSAAVTLKLIKESWTIKAISNKRRIKPNTVKEHILEIALVKGDMPASLFVPVDAYRDLNALFELNPSLTFKEAMETLKECEFFWYRLVEIERMRAMNDSRSK